MIVKIRVSSRTEFTLDTTEQTAIEHFDGRGAFLESSERPFDYNDALRQAVTYSSEKDLQKLLAALRHPGDGW